VSNVSFEGQTEDVLGIWKNHHMLVLPSRAEECRWHWSKR